MSELSEAEVRAERVTALRLPLHAEHVATHNIEKALRNIQIASEQANPGQQRLYLVRAREAVAMARQNMLSTLGHWRGYNERADALIAELLSEGGE